MDFYIFKKSPFSIFSLSISSILLLYQKYTQLVKFAPNTIVFKLCDTYPEPFYDIIELIIIIAGVFSMRKYSLVLFIVACYIFMLPINANADVGPKPSPKVIIEVIV